MKSNVRDKNVEHRSSSIGEESQNKLTTRALAAVVQNPQLVLLLQNENDGMPFQDINELENWMPQYQVVGSSVGNACRQSRNDDCNPG